MTLTFDVRGQGPRLVMAHGFTQNRHCWGPIIDDLATDHEVVLIDAPGHGESSHDTADLWQSAKLLGEIGDEAHYFGYSMGGRMLLHLAVTQPDLMQSLTLLGATAGIVDDDERVARTEADAASADRIATDGLDPFLAGWQTLPMFADLTEAMWTMDQRRCNRTDGVAASLRACGTGRQESLWDRLGALTMPIQFLAGEHDEKFLALAQDLARRSNEFRSVDPAVVGSIPNARHAAHLVNPKAVAQCVRRLTHR